MVNVQLNQTTVNRIKDIKLYPRESHDETINRIINENIKSKEMATKEIE